MWQSVTCIAGEPEPRVPRCPAGGEDRVPRKPFSEAALSEIIGKVQPCSTNWHPASEQRDFLGSPAHSRGPRRAALCEAGRAESPSLRGGLRPRPGARCVLLGPGADRKSSRFQRPWPCVCHPARTRPTLPAPVGTTEELAEPSRALQARAPPLAERLGRTCGRRLGVSLRLQPKPLRSAAAERAATQMGCRTHTPSVSIVLISSFIKMLMNIVFIYRRATSFSGP